MTKQEIKIVALNIAKVAFEAGVMQALYKPESVESEALIKQAALDYTERYSQIIDKFNLVPLRRCNNKDLEERSDDEKFYDNVYSLKG